MSNYRTWAVSCINSDGCQKNHTEKEWEGESKYFCMIFPKKAVPHHVQAGWVTGLVRAPVGWKMISNTHTHTHWTVGKKQPHIEEDNTQCPLRHQFVWMREKWTDSWFVWCGPCMVLLSSSEGQAVGARCSHQEPSRLRPLWGKALWRSACSLWSPGGTEGASCMHGGII